MLAALIIVFREVIEAGLIVGIVLAASKGVPTRGRWVGLDGLIRFLFPWTWRTRTPVDREPVTAAVRA